MAGKLVVRVTALNASPRGDVETTKLIAWVVEGCLEARAHLTWVDLAGLDIRPCRGCLSCVRLGACPQEDHLRAVERRLLASDGIIVGAPAVEGGVAPALKTLTDRLAFQAHYVCAFDDKYVLSVAAGGVAHPAVSAKEAARIFGRRFAVLGVETAGSGGHVPVDVAHRPRLAARARRLGRRFVKSIRRPRRLRPSSLWHAWKTFRRRLSVRLLLAEDPHRFRAVVAAWREKGWLK